MEQTWAAPRDDREISNRAENNLGTKRQWKGVMTMPDRELLPCPFCGGEAEADGLPNYAYYMCKECGASSKTCTTEENARAAWNRRVKLPEPPEERR
jgi:Lar family restriction alleviation protein